MLRCVGPQHAGDIGLRGSVERSEVANDSMRTCVGVAGRSRLRTAHWMLRSISSKRAKAQFRGWLLFEKVLVILECKEAFESTELALLNAQVQAPGRPERYQ